MFVTGAALLAAWCVQITRYVESDAFPLDAAAWTAGKYVAFVFGLSCFPAHALWVRVLHRKRGGLMLFASAFCLCWCVAERVFHVHLL